MNPATLGVFIPIIALSIPIVAIIAGTFSKKYKLMDKEQVRRLEALEGKVHELETRMLDVSGSVDQLEEDQSFVKKLLEQK